MNNRPENKDASNKKRRIAKGLALAVVAGSVLAAATFVPNSQPWGYIASPVLNSTRLKTGNVVAYTPWFEVGSFRGDLLALPVRADGSVGYLNPTWRGAATLDTQNWNTGRRIVTMHDNGSGVPFRTDSMSDSMIAEINADETLAGRILNYVRGDRSGEGTWRTRNSTLGAIIHSNPVFVGTPRRGYTYDNYAAFALANRNRNERVYVGANDGMVHAFDAANGDEIFGYVPSEVLVNLGKLTTLPYTHQYYVDGPLTAEDVQYDSAWHTVLVGGLGAGGKGYFALDVTSAEAADENAAAAKVLWEFTPSSAGAENLGYGYSRPSLVRLDDNGTWGVIVANGYLSSTGKASLYVLNPKTGAVIKELIVPDSDANGLSSPTVVDADEDGIAETVYAGDLNGNLWKFNLGPGSSDAWNVGLSGSPLFTTDAGQPITTAPDIGLHPKEVGLMVYFGTGKLFDVADGNDKTTQAVYGIWDTDQSVLSSQLVTQTLYSVFHESGRATRTVSNNAVNWDSKKGWKTPTQISGASPLDQGERVLQDVTLRDGRVSFLSINPTIPSGENWLIQLDAYTGGAPFTTILDINEDQQLSVADNVDTDGDTVVEDIPTERVVGQYQDFGLASKPVFGVIDANNDSALINHLTAIEPNEEIIPIDPDSDEPGLIGGHFDLDTSSALYDYGDGDTDGHVHEWDDKWDLQVIDFMDLPDDGKLFNIDNGSNSASSSDVFFLTIANTHLSPGGRLEINSSSVPGPDYFELQNRFFSGTLRSGEVFPRFKLTDPTAAEAAAGVIRLDSLKMSFSAYTLVAGGLIPTETGCVRGNDIGSLGEYRNGALLVQATDASNMGAITYDSGNDEYDVAGSNSSFNAEFGHSTRGLIWEASMFWHWDGDCYNEDGWEALYAVCIVGGDGSCLEDVDTDTKDKAEKTKDKDKDKDPDPPEDDPEPGDGGGATGTGVEEDPGGNVSNTTNKGGNNTGRLFWRELVPQE